MKQLSYRPFYLLDMSGSRTAGCERGLLEYIYISLGELLGLIHVRVDPNTATIYNIDVVKKQITYLRRPMIF